MSSSCSSLNDSARISSGLTKSISRSRAAMGTPWEQPTGAYSSRIRMGTMGLQSAMNTDSTKHSERLLHTTSYFNNELSGPYARQSKQ